MEQQDTELLGQYLAGGSHEAFTELVHRHIRLVYWAARRQVRDTHLAEDVAQAVFLILAQRAGGVRNPAMLGGWLVKTTRQVAYNALRLRKRQARREQRAAAMNPSIIEPHLGPSVTESIAPVLDDALARLKELDRSVIVLRFLEGKSLVQVGAAMGVSEQAAQKRVARALERLRQLFARHGIHTAADALPDGLAAQMAGAAPAGLAGAVSAGVIGGAGSAGSAGAMLLAQATSKTIYWAKVKAAAIACAASAALVAGVAAVASKSAAPAIALAAAAPAASTLPATAPTTAPAAAQTTAAGDRVFPLKFSNIILISKNPATEFFTGVDVSTRRTPTSDPAGYIKGVAPNGTTPGHRQFVAPPDLLRGKRIRVSAWAKSKDLANWGGIQLIVYGPGRRVLAQDDMGDRAITGTTEWQQYSVVADIPRDVEMVLFGAVLRGKGELWTDDFRIELVGDDVPVTDDQRWRKWSAVAPHYSVQPDEGVRHEGRASVRISSTSAPGGTWVAYDRNDRHPEKYLGKRIQVSAWIKSDGVRGDAGIWIRVLGPNFQRIAVDPRQDPSGRRPIRGTNDWKLYTVYADVPADAQCIVSGVVMAGKGAVWFDQESVRYELLDTPAGTVPNNK